MVKYIDGDFGPQHFSKDFGFTDSAYESRADHNRRIRQRDGVADNDAAVGEGDGTYVGRSHGGRLHRAVGGSAYPQQTVTPSNRPSSDPTAPGGGALGGATGMVPAVNAAQGANRLIQMGRGSQGAREAMAMQGAHMPPGATQSLVANPPVHTPGIPGLKKGGRAPHPKGVLLIIAGHPGPMPAKRARGGRMCAADGGDVSQYARDQETIRDINGHLSENRQQQRLSQTKIDRMSGHQPRYDLEREPEGVPAPAPWQLDQAPMRSDSNGGYKDGGRLHRADGGVIPKDELMGSGLMKHMRASDDDADIERLVSSLRYHGMAVPKQLLPGDDPDNNRAHGGRLTAKHRHALPSSEFALPGHGEGSDHKGSGSYPIPDQSHARAALSRVAQHGSPAEQERVRSAVHRKYPDIGKR